MTQGQVQRLGAERPSVPPLQGSRSLQRTQGRKWALPETILDRST